MTKTILKPQLYFSYGQFLIYDQSVSAPGCLWTDAHTSQGFARRESSVCFGTLLEFGHAEVAFIANAYTPEKSYERVIAVPFLVSTGTVTIDGPDENDVQRFVKLPIGNYRLVAAQRVVGDEDEAIDLYFEHLDEPLHRSTIIVMDKDLDVPGSLIESADVA